MKRRFNPFFLVISALGVIGLIYSFTSDPAGFFRQLAVILIVVAVIFLVFRYFMRKQSGSEYSSYQKAVKNSKKRGQDKASHSSQMKNNVSPIRKQSSPFSGRKKKPSHLTVIEGKKGKKKNRALF